MNSAFPSYWPSIVYTILLCLCFLCTCIPNITLPIRFVYLVSTILLCLSVLCTCIPNITLPMRFVYLYPQYYSAYPFCVPVSPILLCLCVLCTCIPNISLPMRFVYLYPQYYSVILCPTNKTQVFNEIGLMENWLIIHGPSSCYTCCLSTFHNLEDSSCVKHG